MLRLADVWRCGVAHAPMPEIVRRNTLEGVRVDWLPAGRHLTFLADPFGLWRDGVLHMFAESYDYRNKHGTIEVIRFDQHLGVLDRAPCLEEPWHLSYPFVIEAEGSIWMLPEAHRSGQLTLYRATEFPLKWERVVTTGLNFAGIDASPVFFDGLWWMFHTPAGTARSKLGTLHLAFAERLQGPWKPHLANPVRIDLSSARPGGTPIMVDGVLHAPMQDCRRSYGGAIRMLRINRLTPTTFDAEVLPPMTPCADWAPFDKGLHTLSACGDVTLIDAKRFSGSPMRAMTELQWLATRFRDRPDA